MLLLVENEVVRSDQIPCPGAEAFRAVCQLIGIPFREDSSAGVFGAFPPLTGRKILIGFPASDLEREGPLRDALSRGIRHLEQLIWISGADVTVDSNDLTARRGNEFLHWDGALLIRAGQAFPGRIDLSIIYSWRHRPFASRRLAAQLAASYRETARFETIQGSAWAIPFELRRWYLRWLRGISAPCVLLSIPMINGHVDLLLENFAASTCQGMLKYFGKRPLDASSVKHILSPRSKELASQRDVTEGETPFTHRDIREADDQGEIGPESEGVATPPAQTPIRWPFPDSLGRSSESGSDPDVHQEDRPSSSPRRTQAVIDAHQKAHEFLSSQGMEPTKDLVNEYLLFLQRFSDRSRQRD